ncbi:L-aspartate oxidase [Parvularcula sp. IMCC14364]|uniref:L-aspartate oxidase n=1 Tax=Parvularcula sp. IMCC14364 TaxID=3067902 RepID=UPI0027406B9A|nr:L-aspartate oxidase [Parvularcula sp. IMCC14364]
MASLPTTYNLPDESVLIVGAGIAGLFTALKLAPRPVTIVTAAPLGRGGSSTWAQGGLAAAMGTEDSPALHLQDTLTAGAGLVDAPAASLLTREGPARVEDLIRLGISFDTDDEGKLKLGREAAHGRDRIVHASGDQAGAAIMAGLTKAAQKATHITIRERIVAEEILRDSQCSAAGILAVDIARGERLMMTATQTVLATGGLGGLYAVTTNPVRAQGHGMAMAWLAGAEIMDPEFVQFHPTALNVGVDPAPLATEALRGEGALLVTGSGQRLMQGVHDDMELAPRDIVARAVASAIASGDGAYLDARSSVGARFPEMFPTVYQACRNADIDPVTDLLPIAPAAHYHMGGVRTDLDGQTTLSGLWAVGEVACTGIHGANRLASNSLLEALVFAERAAIAISHSTASTDAIEISQLTNRLGLPSKPADNALATSLRNNMAHKAGILRDAEGLTDLTSTIRDDLATNEMTSGGLNMLIAAHLIAEGALKRQESRGAHLRTDFPDETAPAHSIMTRRGQQLSVEVTTMPVTQLYEET